MKEREGGREGGRGGVGKPEVGAPPRPSSRPPPPQDGEQPKELAESVVALHDALPEPAQLSASEEALLAGASATMQWAVENREMDVDVRLLNAYLSVFARCMRLHRALIVYRSFETDFGQPPNADSAIIILEMLTRANQLDRALAFFRVATGEWTHDDAVAETRHWNIKRPKGVRKRKKMQGMPPPRIVPEEGYGPCVFGGSVEVGREEDGSGVGQVAMD